MTISWCALVGPTLVISVLASSCEAQRLTKNSCSYTETLSDDCYFLFVLQASQLRELPTSEFHSLTTSKHKDMKSARVDKFASTRTPTKSQAQGFV